MFFTEKVYTVQEYSNTRETNAEDIFLRGYKLIFNHEAKIPCSPNELENEFKLAMPHDAIFKGFKNNKQQKKHHQKSI